MSQRVAFLFRCVILISGAGLPAQATPDSVLRLVELLDLARSEGIVKIRHFSKMSSFGTIEGDLAVLADCEGPGVMTALALPNLGGRIRIILDGVQPPVIDAPCVDFFGGKIQPFVDPIVTAVGGGGYCSWPLAFRKRLVVEWIGGEDPGAPGWEVQVEERPGETLKTFSPRLTQQERDARDRVVVAWTTPGRSPVGVARTDLALRDKLKLGPKETKPFLIREGAGVLLTLCVDPYYTTEGAMRASVVEIFVDGAEEPSISAPIGDLCGASYGGVKTRGVILGADGAGTIFQLPIPFQNGLRATLSNRLAEPIEALTLGVVRKLETAPPWRLHGELRVHGINETGPHDAGTITGPGRFVGLSYAAQGLKDHRCLDGPAHLVTDGRTISWSGSESFLGFASAIPSGGFAQARCGVGLREDAPMFRTSAWRIRFADAIPFAEQFKLEFGALQGVRPGCELRTVAFWYGPLRKIRRVLPGDDVLSRRFVLREEGQESASTLDWTGPVPVERKPWEEVSEAFRSTERRVPPAAGGPELDPAAVGGDSRVVLFPTAEETRTFATKLKVPSPGAYEITLVLTTATKGPAVEIFAGEHTLGTVATAGWVPAPAPPAKFGPVDVVGDAIELTLKVGAAPPGTVVGIDAFALKRLP